MLQHCLGANNVSLCKSMVLKCVHCNTDVLDIDNGYKQHIANSAYCKMKKKELDRVGKVIGNYATTGVRINQDSLIKANLQTKNPSKDIICQNVCTSTSSKAQIYSSGHPLTTNVSVIEHNREANLKKRGAVIHRGSGSSVDFEHDLDLDVSEELHDDKVSQFNDIDSSFKKLSKERDMSTITHCIDTNFGNLKGNRRNIIEKKFKEPGNITLDKDAIKITTRTVLNSTTYAKEQLETMYDGQTDILEELLNEPQENMSCRSDSCGESDNTHSDKSSSTAGKLTSIDHYGNSPNIHSQNISNDPDQSFQENDSNGSVNAMTGFATTNYHHLTTLLLDWEHERLSNADPVGVFTPNFLKALQFEGARLLHEMPQATQTVMEKWSRIPCNCRASSCVCEMLSFEKLIKNCESAIYGTACATRIEPKFELVTLNASGRQTTVVWFEFLAKVHDILMCPHSHDASNYIFDFSKENPFDLDVENNENFGDVHETVWFRLTHNKMVSNPLVETLVPLMIYIDGTNIDSYGRLCLEPVTFTLGIFNRKYRFKEEAWRVLGYIPDLDSMYGSKTVEPGTKANDYHQILDVILKSMKSAMHSRSGYDWDFKIIDTSGKETVYRRKLKFALHFVIGDTKGNDMLCGRYGSHNNTTLLCRDCNVKTADADKHNVYCEFLSQTELQYKTERDLNENYSFRKLRINAWNSINFGEQPYGINGATPPEPLHAFLLGIIDYLPKTLYHRLTDKMIRELDLVVARIAKETQRHQTDRTMPNVRPFIHGIKEAKKLTAKEKLGKCFVIYLGLQMKNFRDMVVSKKSRKKKGSTADDITENEYTSWVSIFQSTLAMSQWLYLENHKTQFFKGGRSSVVAMRCRKFLKDYSTKARRTSGQGLKIVKFHHNLHWWKTIIMCGSLNNVDGGRNESIAKTQTKRNARRTQRVFRKLHTDTARRYYVSNVIIRTLSIANFLGYEIEKCFCPASVSLRSWGSTESSQSVKQISHGQYTQGKEFWYKFLYKDIDGVPEDMIEVVKICSGRTITDRKTKNMKEVLPFEKITLVSILNKFGGYNGGAKGRRIRYIRGFTEYKGNTDTECLEQIENDIDIVRAHPLYRSRYSWHDWVKIAWDQSADNQILEANVLAFLDISRMAYIDIDEVNWREKDRHVHPDLPYDGDEHIALVHSVNEMSRDLKNSLCSKKKMENVLNFATCKSFSEKAFCFPIDVDKITGLTSEIISVKPVEKWSNFFLDYDNDHEKLKKTLQREHSQRSKQYTGLRKEYENF